MPVFWILSLLGIEINADFSVHVIVLLGTAFMLAAVERLITHFYPKKIMIRIGWNLNEEFWLRRARKLGSSVFVLDKSCLFHKK